MPSAPSSGTRADALGDTLEVLGFTTVELEGATIVAASPRFCELVGYTVEELRALPDLGPVLVPSDRVALVERISAAFDGDVELPSSAVLLRRDGTPVEAWLAGRAYVDEDGRRRMVLLARDASDEARQREQLAAYAEVLQRMPMGMVLWRVDDPDDPMSLRVVAVNRAATAGSGQRPAELLGRTIGEVFPGPSGPERAEELLEAHRARQLRDLGEVVAAEAEGFFGPGTYRRALVPLPGDMVASLIENVTARREADRHRRNLLQRILDAGDEERRRVAVGLHDDVIQTLAASLFELDNVRRLAADVAGESLDVVERRVRDVITRLRGLVFELLPPELEEGLAAGVDVAAEKTFAGSGTAVVCRFDLAVEPDADTTALAYRIVAEALVNARRHAEASRVEVELRSDEQWLEGVVVDDGKGADELVTPPGHLGLRTMKERAQLLGGTCAVTSRKGEGTTVQFRVPVRASR